MVFMVVEQSGEAVWRGALPEGEAAKPGGASARTEITKLIEAVTNALHLSHDAVRQRYVLLLC
jgi:hypothetical protein